MKNQNDLIFSIVAVLVFLIVFCLTFFMRPTVTMPAAPEKTNLTEPQFPTTIQPVMANSLPGGGSSGGGASRGGGGPAAGGANAGMPANKANGLPQLGAAGGG